MGNEYCLHLQTKTHAKSTHHSQCIKLQDSRQLEICLVIYMELTAPKEKATGEKRPATALELRTYALSVEILCPPSLLCTGHRRPPSSDT